MPIFTLFSPCSGKYGRMGGKVRPGFVDVDEIGGGREIMKNKKEGN